jgi:hypothetical protein
MIKVRVYWDGFYQGEFESPVRIQRNDMIWGTLFQNVVTGEKFKVTVASEIDIFLYSEWQSKKDDIAFYQNVTVIRLE